MFLRRILNVGIVSYYICATLFCDSCPLTIPSSSAFCPAHSVLFFVWRYYIFIPPVTRRPWLLTCSVHTSTILGSSTLVAFQKCFGYYSLKAVISISPHQTVQKQVNYTFQTIQEALYNFLHKDSQGQFPLLLLALQTSHYHRPLAVQPYRQLPSSS